MDHNMIPGRKNSRSGLSAAEFERNLFYWLEDRGLLDELRAHLRQQMVKALNDTSLGPNPSRRLKQSVSPKIQAINLLVAEFLLHQDYHYTLSVFTSEVPLLRSAPEFIKSASQISDQNSTQNETTPYFKHQELKDILEILGLSMDTEVGNKIYSQYQDNSEGTALLTCIFQNVHFVLKSRTHVMENNSSQTEFPTRDSDSDRSFKDAGSSSNGKKSVKRMAELYNAEMQEILFQSQMKSQHIKQLQEEIRRFQESEIKKVKSEEEAKYAKELTLRESRMQAEFNHREEEIARKLKNAEDRLLRKKQSLDEELQKRQEELSEQEIQLNNQRIIVTQNQQQLEKREEELENQERAIEELKRQEELKLAERSSEIDMRQQQLLQEYERLHVERETLSYMQHQFEENRRQFAIEASQSLAHAKSQTNFLHELQQLYAHLHHEVMTTRNKVDNVVEQQTHPTRLQQPVERIDKGLQTTLPLPVDEPAGAAESEILPVHDREMELTAVDSQRELQQQNQYLSQLLREMQTENEQLRGHIRQQRLRIDELTSHAAHLANQLEDAHVAVTLLSHQQTLESSPTNQQVYLSAASGTITAPPLTAPSSTSPPQPPPPPPPPLPPRHEPSTVVQSVQSHQLGAGEELQYMTPPSTQPFIPPFPASTQSSSHSQRREGHKKPPRRLMVYSNTSSSEETSPTEEILQEARRRLRRLEEESEAVDRSYRDFRMRQSENLSAAGSLIFSPLRPPPAFLTSNHSGYGSFTASQPVYSFAETGSHSYHTASNFRNIYDYTNRLPQRIQTWFNPLFPRTYIPPLFQTARLPSTSSFTFGNRTQNQYTFSQRLSTTATVDSTSTIVSPRISTNCPSYRFVPDDFPTRASTVDTSAATIVQPQLSTSRTVQMSKLDSTPSRSNRGASLSQTNLLDMYNLAPIEPHSSSQETKNVTFGNLKTVTVYSSPQVSSQIQDLVDRVDEPRQDQTTNDNIHPHAATLSLETNKTVSTTISTSTVQSESEREIWSKDILKEIDDLQSCAAGSSASSTQDEWVSSHIKKKHSYRNIRKTNGKRNKSGLSSDSILKLKQKSSSHSSTDSGSGSDIIKETKSTDRVKSDITSDNQALLEKLFPLSEEIKSLPSTSHDDNKSSFLASSGTSQMTGSEGFSHILSSNISNTSSGIKELGLESEEFALESSSATGTINERISNKSFFDASADIQPIQEEDISSEKTGTQVTVRTKEADTVNSLLNTVHIVVTIDQDVGKTIADIGTDVTDGSHQVSIGATSSGIHLTSLTEQDDDDHIGLTVGNENKNLQVMQKGSEERETLRHDTQSRDGSVNVSEDSDVSKDHKLTSLEAEKDLAAESVAEDSDQPISIGEESKKDDSSKDFW
ncbi:uro-adherence factor A-like [Periplaneta americana]|uniref:uro-adherence factor A-like n=1 Tax=Periplaneta americana TaxID=6978 RepID=UPI0037E756B6